MKLLRIFPTAGLLALAVATAVDSNGLDDDVHQIAIIGSGAAGASAAYHLRRFADEDGVAINITVLEKTDRIGGRTLTVNAYDDPDQRVELGASIFVQINHILWNATQDFGLPLRAPGSDIEGVLAIWDGDRFVYTQDESSSDWWSLTKLFWKYGMAPYRANKLMQATVNRFLSLYDAPYFPFRSLTTRAYELELHLVTSQTGEQFLEHNNIAALFSHDIVQASTRVNYASNLARIHGLDTMVALAPQGASQVEGGNWQIFDRFVQASKADFQSNTSVTGISFAPDSTPQTPKYLLQTKSTGGAKDADASETTPLAFNHVVIAAPYQFSGIDAAEGVLQQAVDVIPYVRLHVTLFTSPLALHPAFFKLPDDAQVPTTVLTTLGADDDASSGVDGAGKAGFFSISTLRLVTNPKTNENEFLYKIFSPEKVTAAFLTRLLGAEVPESITMSSPAKDVEDEKDEKDEPTSGSVISWYYPHIFHSYPKAYPRVTFQDPILGNRLYYTSGIESFISTMETSALAGRNVARLIVDDIQGRTTGGSVVQEVLVQQPNDL